MGNRYELITKIQSDILFLKLLKKGLLPLSVLDRKVYYEYFLNEFKTNKRWQAITNTADEFNVCESTIRRAIKYMEL